MKKLLVSAVALAMLAGCSSGGAASTANTSGGTAGKSVTIATDTDILSMNSSTSTDGTSFIALTMCEAGLTQLDEKNVPVSDLAESWYSLVFFSCGLILSIKRSKLLIYDKGIRIKKNLFRHY